MKKRRRRLSDEEALFLGLKPREKRCPQGRNPQYYVTKKEMSRVVSKFRTETKEVATKSVQVQSQSDTVPNDYGSNKVLLSARKEGGGIMDIETYCEFYDIPRENVSSYKLITHTGIPYYNIVFKEGKEDLFTLDDIRSSLKDYLLKQKYTYNESDYDQDREGVAKLSDLHFGAFIRNLLITQDYDDTILLDKLMVAARKINSLGLKKAHVHINGDLIESFSGLNHVNSWMSMDPKIIGANAVMLCTNTLDKFLREVKNLGEVKIVAGNHDRTSKANDEDVKGGAAKLIAWGLRLKGYKVEFHPIIITHRVEGINHINLHGHFGISKRTTEKILWEFGEKGCFNYISEGHLHSIIQELSESQRGSFKQVRDDSIDHRRGHLPPFFTGNYYSETLGFFTNAGFEIVTDNGYGKPEVLQIPL